MRDERSFVLRLPSAAVVLAAGLIGCSTQVAFHGKDLECEGKGASYCEQTFGPGYVCDGICYLPDGNLTSDGGIGPCPEGCPGSSMCEGGECVGSLAVQILSPTGAADEWLGADVEVRGLVSHPAGSNPMVTCEVDGGDSVAADPEGEGVFSCLLTLTDGRHDVVLRAVDGDAEASDSRMVQVDTEAPAVTWVSPLPGTVVGAGKVGVQVETTDTASGLASLLVTVKRPGETEERLAECSGSPCNAVLEVKKNDPSGEWKLSARAEDAVGNAVRKVLLIEVDLQPPNLSEVVPSLPYAVPRDRDLDLKLTFDEPAASVELVLVGGRRGGSDYVIPVAQDPSTAVWTATIPGRSLQAGSLGPQPPELPGFSQDYEVLVRVSDAFGNAAELPLGSLTIHRDGGSLPLGSLGAASVHGPVAIDEGSGSQRLYLLLDGGPNGAQVVATSYHGQGRFGGDPQILGSIDGCTVQAGPAVARDSNRRDHIFALCHDGRLADLIVDAAGNAQLAFLADPGAATFVSLPSVQGDSIVVAGNVDPLGTPVGTLGLYDLRELGDGAPAQPLAATGSGAFVAPAQVVSRRSIVTPMAERYDIWVVGAGHAHHFFCSGMRTGPDTWQCGTDPPPNLLPAWTRTSDVAADENGIYFAVVEGGVASLLQLPWETGMPTRVMLLQNRTEHVRLPLRSLWPDGAVILGSAATIAYQNLDGAASELDVDGALLSLSTGGTRRLFAVVNSGGLERLQTAFLDGGGQLSWGWAWPPLGDDGLGRMEPESVPVPVAGYVFLASQSGLYAFITDDAFGPQGWYQLGGDVRRSSAYSGP